MFSSFNLKKAAETYIKYLEGMRIYMPLKKPDWVSRAFWV
jgi:hypothetical protein